MTGDEYLPAIAAIPGGDGWFHPDNGDVYADLARTLIDSGFTQDEAVDLLARAYGAAANEFGC